MTAYSPERVTERKPIAAAKLVEPPRCSDYDYDCAGVMDHAACHRGFGPRPALDGGIEYMNPADGYCPYLGQP